MFKEKLYNKIEKAIKISLKESLFDDDIILLDELDISHKIINTGLRDIKHYKMLYYYINGYNIHKGKPVGICFGKSEDTVFVVSYTFVGESITYTMPNSTIFKARGINLYDKTSDIIFNNVKNIINDFLSLNNYDNITWRLPTERELKWIGNIPINNIKNFKFLSSRSIKNEFNIQNKTLNECCQMLLTLWHMKKKFYPVVTSTNYMYSHECSLGKYENCPILLIGEIKMHNNN